MKRKRLFSALMALAMILSLCTFASATDPVAALAPGSDNKDHMTVSALGDLTGATQTVPAEFAGATIAYTATYTPADPDAATPVAESFDVTLGAFSAATDTGYAVAWKNTTAASLLGTTAAVIEFTKASSPTFELTVTPDGQSPKTSITDGVITLGQAGAFRPAVAADTDGQLNSYAQDSVNGEVTNEGPLPPDVINVKVPTDAQTKDAFDLYLDPHDLIKDSVTKRYTGITASGDGRLYFKNSASTMSNSSAELKIVNKSNVAVSVDLSVEATKGANAFTFVDTAAGVDDATDAAIYLALKSGTTETAISDTADANGKNIAKIETSIDTDESWYELNWHGPEKLGYYSYDMTSTLAGSTNDADFKSITFSLTGAINEDDAWDAIDTFGLSVIWDVKAYEAPPEPTDPNATVGTPFNGPGSTLSIDLTWGTLAKAKTNAQLTITATGGDLTATATSSDSTLTYTFTGNQLAYNKIQGPATVVFYNTAPTDADAVTVNLNVLP